MESLTFSNSFNIPEIKIPEEYFTTGFAGSSKGYSKKALYQGRWYKVSAGIFNAQAETVASRLAKYTSLPSYIKYDICKINGEWGTVSDDFIKDRNHETIKGLHAKLLSSPIEDIESQLTGADLFNYIIKFVRGALGIDMTDGLNLILRFDSIILNEDRHFRNLEFVEISPDVWRMLPPFDFDCSFFSQVEDWDEIETYVHKSQPFFRTHKEQIAFINTVSNKRLVLHPFNPLSIVNGIWDENYQLDKSEVLRYLETIKGGVNRMSMKQTLDNCTFKYFYRDECTALVKVRGGVVTCERYTDNPLHLPFGRMPDRSVTKRGLKLFFSEHCVPEHRANLQDFLDYYGLEKHDPFKICLITNGVMAGSLYRLEWVENE